MKRKRGVFRVSACAAKERLGSGFWTETRAEREQSVKVAVDNGKSSGEMLNLYINQIKSRVVRVQESDPADEAFYQKICALLRSHSSINPLGAVIDREYMRGLGDAERERYVFRLSERVRACVTRFEQEREFASAKSL